jgi:hypothetical protein
MRHPRRNEVFRDVGSEPHGPDDPEFVDLHEVPFDPGDALLLCSDGLSDLVESAAILRVVGEHAGDPNAIVHGLIDAANVAGGKDNITAVYIQKATESAAVSLGNARGRRGLMLATIIGLLLIVTGFFAYRAGTVVLVTTVYVVSTISFSGILERGLLGTLIPIGVLAGLSAVVTLLLIVALASNKIQGIAMVRALGVLTAGLPCLGWFVDSAWNLAFGVLPPYWAAKAFWVANEHGVWWPYVLVGMIYNLAVGYPLLRRFLAKNTE